MTVWDLSARVNLASPQNKRVDRKDTRRQMKTANAILERLRERPGQILADEVGLGKTYTALAVAASVAIRNPKAGPVVVMVPPALREKWPREWAVFQELCLEGRPLRIGQADRGSEFLKLLDDKPSERARIIFLKNGAFGAQLNDPWIRLAVVRQAMLRRRGMEASRRAVAKWGARVVRGEQLDRRHPGLVQRLLETPPKHWLDVVQREGVAGVDDDPIPRALLKTLSELNLDDVRAGLEELPQRRSLHAERNLRRATDKITRAIGKLWQTWLAGAHFESPLLILDEAHHAKNPGTQLSRLFQNEEEGGGENPGTLYSRFERMLFLTATPFQLGHHELLQVLSRFGGVDWSTVPMTEEEFGSDVSRLRVRLGAAQRQVARLDSSWGSLRNEDVEGLESDWLEGPASPALPDRVVRVRRIFREAVAAKKLAQAGLKLWVIRHGKGEVYASTKVPRRRVLRGAEMVGGEADRGLEVSSGTLLPFLLAGRGQVAFRAGQREGAIPARARALFADGICSSFEAYTDTRAGLAVDDEIVHEGHASSPEVDWYVAAIRRALPRDDPTTAAAHPKVAATVERVRRLWLQGEKVVVFCHFRATGRALRRHLSHALDRELRANVVATFGVPEKDVDAVVGRLGDRLQRRSTRPSPVRLAAERELQPIVDGATRCGDEERENLLDLLFRFLRSPVVLARYGAPIQREGGPGVREALGRKDLGGAPLRERFVNFISYVDDLVGEERSQLLDALDRIQTGSYYAERSDLADEAVDGEAEQLLPTVRLVNGTVKTDARQRLMAAFNSPLLPEVLVASQVLAEGIDLHHDCRQIVHHDLDWNPSTLEQRTGRVDRLGSKGERLEQPIEICLPYLAKTQDEKMYRVVRDRERWFQVVMGGRHELDEAELDDLAARVELPEAAAKQLAFQLAVVRS